MGRPRSRGPNIRVAALTATALTAFAGNSVLCRLALKEGAIDAAGFTAVRLTSGALTLSCLLLLIGVRATKGSSAGSWISASMLSLYAVCFSFAYLTLQAGTGALILFGTVQATMIAGSLWGGARPSRLEWTGWLLAVAGFVYLLSPGLTAPPPGGAALMALAGVGWGVYSLRGRRESDFMASTAFNFVRGAPLAVAVAALGYAGLHLTPRGILLAVISGAVTSGAGYAVWYAALRGLSGMQAALVQLSVPALAAGGGALLLSEPFTLRLAAAGVFILGGISLALLGGSKKKPPAAH